MKTNRAIVLSSLSLLAACLNAGCIGAPDSELDSEYEEEDIMLNEAESALVGCQTVTPDATVSLDGIGPNGEKGSTSPNASYDHGPGCPGRYVVNFVDVDGYTSSILTAGDGWGEAVPTDNVSCFIARTEVTLSAMNGSGSWDTLGTVIHKGNWNGYTCTLLPVGGNSLTVPSELPGKVKLEVKALTRFCFGGSCLDTPKKARASIHNTTPQ